MIDLLLVLLYYFSLFMMTAGIWMIIDTLLSKDKSMGIGMPIGVVIILLGVLFFTISTIPQSEDESEIHTETKNNHPVPTFIPSSTP